MHNDREAALLKDLDERVDRLRKRTGAGAHAVDLTRAIQDLAVAHTQLQRSEERKSQVWPRGAWQETRQQRLRW